MQTDIHSRAVVMPCPIYSFAARLRRHPAGSAEARIEQSAASRDAWVISLHLAACRRWLASEPPGLDRAEQTLRLICETAGRTATTDTFIIGTATSGATDRKDPAARLQELQHRLEDLENSLHAALPISEP